LRVEGPLAEVTIRHSTLVPGWGLDADCAPERPAEPSLELDGGPGRLVIASSIVGSVQLSRADDQEHVIVAVRDSVLDATAPGREALGAPGRRLAHAVLSVQRSTVFGEVHTHAVELGENSIFDGRLLVARRQHGCLRFCSVQPGSRTPQRYRCQPDLAVARLSGAAARHAELRVRPRFDSVRYGRPAYARLSVHCDDAIARGAGDESQMGVYHDLFEPQRLTNLRTRLREFVPAGMDAGVYFAT
jgi:hypothetical protein